MPLVVATWVGSKLQLWLFDYFCAPVPAVHATAITSSILFQSSAVPKGGLPLSPRLFSGDLLNVNILHNWTFPFSFPFSPPFDVPDSFEPLKVVVGHLVPAAGPYLSLRFPWASGPGLIFIAN